MVTHVYWNACRFVAYNNDIYGFVCSLFNDTISNLGYIASNEEIISEWLTGKDLKVSGRGLS
jgi:hypothetical protein